MFWPESPCHSRSLNYFAIKQNPLSAASNSNLCLAAMTSSKRVCLSRLLKQRGWSLEPLEPRLLLAADVSAAVSSTVIPADDVDSAAPSRVAEFPAADSLVIIDGSIDNFESLVAAIPKNADLVVLDGHRDALEQMNEAMRGRTGLKSLHLIAHGSAGSLTLGNFSLDDSSIISHRDAFQRWRTAFSPGADLLIYGCETGAGSRGLSLMQSLRDQLDVDVAASIDNTGSDEESANWILERQLGEVTSFDLLARLADSEFSGHLGIEVFAAGSTGDEQMQLQIGSNIVATWSLAGTSANGTPNYRTFNYNVDGISPNEVRINFINDLYNPGAGIDRNLRIDRVRIDGVDYQAEAPSVFSTGTWKPQDGIAAGNRESEFLHANGYFQFAGNATGTIVRIHATGQTGQETAQLLLDGNVVQTFNNVSITPSVYQYQFNQIVTADRLRIAFANDAYDPSTGFDRNLVVDRIEVGGVTYQSEASTTYSTGTWLPADGIQPGFRGSETLHTDGYFQYAGVATNPGGNSGSFSLTTSEVSVNESSSIVQLVVTRLGGTDGAASIDYLTVGDTATAGQDFANATGTLRFASGESTKTITINILNDTVAEGTESFGVRLDNPIGAGLLAPRTAVVAILDDDGNLPAFASFTSTNGLTLNGGATVTGGSLQLTSAATQQAGSAYYRTPITVTPTTSFQTSFAFQIGGGSGTAGADGFTFLIQNAAQGLGAIGGTGGFLGYNNILRSIAVEFDTFKNTWDDAANQISVLTNGNVTQPIAKVAAPYKLNSGSTLYAWVDYNGGSNILAVYLSDTVDKPVFAALKTQIDLSAIVGNQGYVGFTGSNFNVPNYHRISRWNLTLETPQADPPTTPTGNIVEQNIISGLTQPLAVVWSPDARNLYIAEKAGVVKVARDGATNPSVLIDISAQVNNVQDRGLLDIALHPNFQQNGYIYLLYTYDPPQVFNNVGNSLAGPDGTGNRAGRLVRMTANAATGFTTIVPGSEVVILGTASTWNNFNAFVDSTNSFNEPPAGQDSQGNYLRDFINSDSRSHTVGSLAFGLDGALFVSIGDGASFNQTDVRALRVQDVNSLSGKVLRIDSLTGRGLSDNPFFNGDADANRSKVYQLGLRNPWRLTVDQNTGRLFIGETGLNSFEEVNTGGPGTNFGWPFYEGGQGVNVRTPGYRDLAQAQAFYASGATATPGLIALAHGNGANAVVLGDIVYDSNLGPQYNGYFFYNDLYRGIVRRAKVDGAGNLSDVTTFTTGAEFVVDIQQGPDGSLYYVNLVEGTVGRWRNA